MDTIEAQQAELQSRIDRLKRNQKIHNAYTIALLLLGAAIGYAIAQYVIDPVTVVPGCGGIET